MPLTSRSQDAVQKRRPQAAGREAGLQPDVPRLPQGAGDGDQKSVWAPEHGPVCGTVPSPHPPGRWNKSLNPKRDI